MPKSTPQGALARRALIEDIQQDRRGWLQHGAAALAVSLLGLGVAGSLALTGNAESIQTGTAPATQASASAVPPAFDRGADRNSRDSQRAVLDEAKLKSLADQRAEELSKTDGEIQQAATVKAAAARETSLESTTKATANQGTLIARQKAQAAIDAAVAAAEARARANAQTTARARPAAAAPAPPAAPAAPAAPQAPAALSASTSGATTSGKNCTPVTSGYSIAARFGQVGSWSRYHTGIDFSAPVGTALHAPSSGVVTNAGSGPASGWAGNYVAIRYPDGTSSLMAHMSTVSVSVGQTVSACQVVGAVGMTGRTFGPHVHFEIYPAGVTPGDVYKAVNPVPWLNAQGLRP